MHASVSADHAAVVSCERSRRREGIRGFASSRLCAVVRRRAGRTSTERVFQRARGFRGWGAVVAGRRPRQQCGAGAAAARDGNSGAGGSSFNGDSSGSRGGRDNGAAWPRMCARCAHDAREHAAPLGDARCPPRVVDVAPVQGSAVQVVQCPARLRGSSSWRRYCTAVPLAGAFSRRVPRVGAAMGVRRTPMAVGRERAGFCNKLPRVLYGKSETNPSLPYHTQMRRAHLSMIWAPLIVTL